LTSLRKHNCTVAGVLGQPAKSSNPGAIADADGAATHRPAIAMTSVIARLT
jgi:hypothetical protein